MKTAEMNFPKHNIFFAIFLFLACMHYKLSEIVFVDFSKKGVLHGGDYFP